jgi:hypothetical protein
MPIYTVANKKAETGTNPRLVDAANKAQALKHVADDFEVEVPTQTALVKLVQAGVKVEDAKGEPA